MGDDKTTKPVTFDDIMAVTNAYMLDYFKRAMFVPWFKSPESPFEFPDSKPKETVIGYVEAWRWWVPKISLVPHHRATDCVCPGSNNIEYDWLWDGENIASEPPTFQNSHGFYAYTPEGIEDHQNALFGRVALYGDVVHCKYGYRAEKARILDVWVDEDYIRENPSIWELLRRIPQVKGTFDTHDPILYNSRGEREDYQCLILEHQKELSGTSLSDGRTTSRPSNQTMLVIDRRLSSRQWRMSQWNQFAHGIPQWSPYTYRWSDTPGKMTGHVLLPKYSREPEWVVKPDGDVCTYCDRLITDDQPVAVEYTFPDDMQIKALNGTFEWVKKRHHLDCMVRFMIEPPMFTSNDTISILGGV